MRKIIKLTILLTILLIVGSCSSYQELEINTLELPTINENDSFDEVLSTIDELKAKIGNAPVPVIIENDNKKYIAFTEEQLKKLEASNELRKYLEKQVRNIGKKSDLYVVELKHYERLVKIQHQELILLTDLYNISKRETHSLRQEKMIEGITYKSIIIGLIIVILSVL